MEPTPTDFRRYVRTLMGTIAVTVGMLALLSITVDPYGMFRRLRLPNFGYPPLAWSRVAAAERIGGKCDVALLGSSRVVFGFGTKMQPIRGMRPCNGALGGTSIEEQTTVVDFMVKHSRVKAVLFFVDLHMFHDDRGKNHDWAQSKLNASRSRIDYYAWGLTSLDSMEWSTKMVGLYLPIFDAPKPPRPSSMETRGMIKTTLLRSNMYRRFEGPDVSRRQFTHMLDQLQGAGIEVMVVIPPEHALQIELLWTAGLWDVNKAWKRFLTEECHKRDIPLWDFETYHSPAKVRLPTKPTEPPNQWWSDLSHQSNLLGVAMLDRINEAAEGRSGEFEPEFGVQLTPETVEPTLARMDTDRIAYRAAHPEQIAYYESVLHFVGTVDPTMWADLESNKAYTGPDGIVRWPKVDGAQVDLGEDEDLEF